MKKVILFLTVLMLSVGTFAQAVTTLKSQYTLTSDTVVNTATKYLSTGQLTGMQKVEIVTITGTKISGTVAGTASLEASLDGTNWYSASSTAYTMTDVAAQTFAWSITDFGGLYVRVKVVGTGTMSNIITAKQRGLKVVN